MGVGFGVEVNFRCVGGAVCLHVNVGGGLRVEEGVGVRMSVSGSVASGVEVGVRGWDWVAVGGMSGYEVVSECVGMGWHGDGCGYGFEGRWMDVGLGVYLRLGQSV